jgi:hypothetical protein
MAKYDPEAQLDHYKFWEIDPKDYQRDVDLKDQFDVNEELPLPQTLERLVWIANPVEKEFNHKVHGIKHPDAHLLGYFFTAKPQKPRWVVIQNQLNPKPVLWKLGDPTMLLLPASKVHEGAPPKPPTDVGHFECYLVTKADPAGGVVLEDQFDKIVGKKETLTTLEPAFFCVPVSKDGEEIVHPNAHLALYDIALEERTSLRKLGKTIKVSARDQFKTWDDLTVLQSLMLGVPTDKQKWGEGEPPRDVIPPDSDDITG